RAERPEGIVRSLPKGLTAPAEAGLPDRGPEMKRLIATAMFAALVAAPALAQSGSDDHSPKPILQTPNATSPAPQVDSLAPNAHPSARPAEDWQSAVHESGDAG